MPYPSYLTIAEHSTIWQNGCVPLAWLALLRDAETVRNSADTGFGGWQTTPWEATNSLDRSINVLQRDDYFWAYFNVLSLLLDEIQQLPTEEEIIVDVSEFAAFDTTRETDARAAAERFREMLRALYRGDRDAALTLLRELAASLNLDRPLPFTGNLEQDIVALGGPDAALQELTWSIMGEMYDGPEERTEWYTAAYYLENFWGWTGSGGHVASEADDEIEIIPEIHHNGHLPDL